MIDRAEVCFGAGSTVFTGETGSGKTMVLGALAFVLGERADAGVVRRDIARASVTLWFDPDAALRARLRDEGFPIDDDEEASVVRDLTENGKSSLRLNGRATTAAFIRGLAAEIVEIVGQHEAQRLLAPAYQGELLDRYGGDPVETAATQVRHAYEEATTRRRELAELDEQEQRAREQAEFARFALAEIEAAALEPGEDLRLHDRRRILDNAERVATALRAAHEAVAAEAGVADALGGAIAALRAIADVAPVYAALADAAAALQSEAGEIGAATARELEALEFDPGELEAINQRLDAIDSLARKYGGSLAAVIASADRFRALVDVAENAGAKRAALGDALAQAESRMASAAATLSERRRAAADRLQRTIEPELAELAMSGARFEAALVAGAIGARGAETVEFRFAANRGEPLRPLGKAASGGELSRVLLALVVALTTGRETTALVFDEIDAGIGGATAQAVGTRIARIAQNRQVLCVTHLAQIAAVAKTQVVLDKRESHGRTTIALREVGEDERIAEIARMLSGEQNDAALTHARNLLHRAAP